MIIAIFYRALSAERINRRTRFEKRTLCRAKGSPRPETCCRGWLDAMATRWRYGLSAGPVHHRRRTRVLFPQSVGASRPSDYAVSSRRPVCARFTCCVPTHNTSLCAFFDVVFFFRVVRASDICIRFFAKYDSEAAGSSALRTFSCLLDRILFLTVFADLVSTLGRRANTYAAVHVGFRVIFFSFRCARTAASSVPVT